MVSDYLFMQARQIHFVDVLPEAGPYSRLDSGHIMEKLVFT